MDTTGLRYISMNFTSNYGSSQSKYCAEKEVSVKRDPLGIVVKQKSKTDSGNGYDLVLLDLDSAEKVAREILGLVKGPVK